jgi:outer membrane lipoprotein-sorting protein
MLRSKSILFVILILFLSVSPVFSISMKDFRENLEDSWGKVMDFKAEMVQETVYPGQAAGTYKGAIKLKQPGMFRLDFSEPLAYLFVCDGKQLTQIDFGKQAARTEWLAETEAELMTIGLLRDEADRDPNRFNDPDYDKSLEDEMLGNRKTYRLTVFPMKAGSEFIIRQLWVDAETFLPVRLYIENSAGIKMTMSFKESRVNENIEYGQFSFEVPDTYEFSDKTKDN